MTFRVTKDPAAVLDYGFDWSAWLGTDAIASVRWSVPKGMTKQSQESTGSIATVWLAGGVAGTAYTVSCRITTEAGRVDERSVLIEVADR